MKSIRIICFILIAIVLSSVTVFATESYITLNGFTFFINSDGYAVIHKYEGTETDVVIPDKLLGAKVLTIEDYAFFGNTNIESVSFERTTQLATIGTDAFYGCTGLKALNIPSTVSEISFGAFQNCTGLERVKIENGLSAIGEQVFLNCTALVEIEIPDSVTSIADSAFTGCDSQVIVCSSLSFAYSYSKEKGISYSLTDPLIGDVNCDGKITIRDVTVIQMYKVGLINLSPISVKSADVTGDNKVNIRDVTTLQLYLADIHVPSKIGQQI